MALLVTDERDGINNVSECRYVIGPKDRGFSHGMDPSPQRSPMKNLVVAPAIYLGISSANFWSCRVKKKLTDVHKTCGNLGIHL